MSKLLKLPILMLIFSLFLVSSVFGESADYNSTFGAPICVTGDYTSSSPCSSGTLLNNRDTSESNYYNMVDECYDVSAGFPLTTYTVEQITAWDSDGDGKLENGDTVQVAFYGNCNEGDDIYLSLWYSLNPEDGNSANWTKIDSVDYDYKDVCVCGSGGGCNNYDETVTIGGFTERSFTITGSPDYVAVRLLVEGDSGAHTIENGCRTTGQVFDGDDLILAMYVPFNNPEIISLYDSSITTSSVRINLEFSYNDSTDVTNYLIFNDENQTRINYTKDTSETESLFYDISGLDSDTTYTYDYCIEYENSGTQTTCNGEQSFTTLKTPPQINIVSTSNTTWNSTRLGGSFSYEDYINVSATFVFNGSNEDSIYFTKDVSSAETVYLNISDLESNTTYTYKLCINYGDGYLLYNCSDEYNFTTLVREAPNVIIVSFVNISGTYLDMSGSFAYNEYNTVKATLIFYDEEFSSISFGQLFDYDDNPSQYFPADSTITGLTENTTYEYDMCLDYGGESAPFDYRNCYSDSFTYEERLTSTGFDPIITLSETLLEYGNEKLNINIDHNNAENVNYTIYLRDMQVLNWTTANDGLNEYSPTDLEPRTNYTYYVKVSYSTLGYNHIISSDNRTFTTYYDNAFDDIWDNLLQGSIIAKLLLGFVIVIGIIFLGVSAFGYYNFEIKAGGILILGIIGVIIATLMKLFPLYLLLLMIIGMILLFIVKNTIFGDNN